MKTNRAFPSGHYLGLARVKTRSKKMANANWKLGKVTSTNVFTPGKAGGTTDSGHTYSDEGPNTLAGRPSKAPS